MPQQKTKKPEAVSIDLGAEPKFETHNVSFSHLSSRHLDMLRSVSKLAKRLELRTSVNINGISADVTPDGYISLSQNVYIRPRLDGK